MVATATWLGRSNSSRAISGSVTEPTCSALSVMGSSLGPAPGVIRILGSCGLVGQEQRAEGIDHYRSLVRGRAAGLHSPDHRLDRTGYRSVREARGVQGDRADPDA